MPLEIVTSYETLIYYMKEYGKNPTEENKAKLEDYREMCLKADRMIMPFTIGELIK